MKNIILVEPKLKDYYYEQKLDEDKDTMSYNAGYDIDNPRYNYNDGTIKFPKEFWKEMYEKRIREHRFLAYVKDTSIGKYVGIVNYHYVKDTNRYEMGVIIEAKYRSKGYSKPALRLLINKAKEDGVRYLYDTIEDTRESAIKAFTSVGFTIYKKETWKKFNKDVNGIVLRVDTFKEPSINNLKTIEDVYKYMDDNIRYGFKDINGDIHIGNMKGFRTLYRTMSIEDVLKYKIGTCIDQVNIMHFLLNKIGVKNKMFVTRIYESGDSHDEEEHMHMFILCYKNNKVYQIEHPNWYKKGIYEYKDEKEAIEKINKYYVKLSGGIPRPVTEIYKVDSGLSFNDFNSYVNSLDITFRKLKNDKNDYEKLYKWCQKKQVYEWFEQRKLSYDEIENKYKRKLKEKKQELLIIRSDNKDIGLVQIYKYDDVIKIPKQGMYKNIYEYDLYIGEDVLSNGIGTKVVSLINDRIISKYNANLIVLRPFKRNVRAIKCYLKNGFKEVLEYDGFDTVGNPEIFTVLIKEI